MKKTYRVTGRGYEGHEPGETFEAELDEGAEARAIARGAIKVVTKKTKSEKEEAE